MGSPKIFLNKLELLMPSSSKTMTSVKKENKSTFPDQISVNGS